jgi:hypothetical protein
MHARGLRLRSACDALATCRAPQYCLPVNLTPFLYDSFIRYFTPVYPDAIQVENLPHKGAAALAPLRGGRPENPVFVGLPHNTLY